MTYIFVAAWLVTLAAFIYEWAEKGRLERENLYLDGMTEYLKNEEKLYLDGMTEYLKNVRTLDHAATPTPTPDGD